MSHYTYFIYRPGFSIGGEGQHVKSRMDTTDEDYAIHLAKDLLEQYPEASEVWVEKIEITEQVDSTQFIKASKPPSQPPSWKSGQRSELDA